MARIGVSFATLEPDCLITLGVGWPDVPLGDLRTTTAFSHTFSPRDPGARHLSPSPGGRGKCQRWPCLRRSHSRPTCSLQPARWCFAHRGCRSLSTCPACLGEPGWPDLGRHGADESPGGAHILPACAASSPRDLRRAPVGWLTCCSGGAKAILKRSVSTPQDRALRKPSYPVHAGGWTC